MIAQVLAMIRSDDHQRILQDPPPAQLIEQRSQPPIEIGDAIVVDVMGHAYVVDPPGFFFGKDGKPGPGEVLRSTPFDRISFANSDLAGIMDHRTSILEAHRAVTQSLARIQA